MILLQEHGDSHVEVGHHLFKKLILVLKLLLKLKIPLFLELLIVNRTGRLKSWAVDDLSRRTLKINLGSFFLVFNDLTIGFEGTIGAVDDLSRRTLKINLGSSFLVFNDLTTGFEGIIGAENVQVFRFFRTWKFILGRP